MRQEESGEESSGRPMRADEQMNEVWAMLETKKKDNQSKNWQIGTVMDQLPQKEQGRGRVRPRESELNTAGAWWADEMQVWE